jgi:hypothetical protein
MAAQHCKVAFPSEDRFTSAFLSLPFFPLAFHCTLALAIRLTASPSPKGRNFARRRRYAVWVSGSCSSEVLMGEVCWDAACRRRFRHHDSLEHAQTYQEPLNDHHQRVAHAHHGVLAWFSVLFAPVACQGHIHSGL